MTPNDTLMEQCRREAEEKYPDDEKWVSGSGTTGRPSNRCATMRKAYAAALYHERSKPRTSLSVEEVMEEMTQELQRVSHVEYDSHEICKHYAEKVRARLTAKLNELNTQTNG